MTGGGPSAAGKWADLSRRVASTIVLLAIGVVLAFTTGIWLHLGISVICSITFWELAAMTGWRSPRFQTGPFGRWRPVALSAIAGLAQFAALLLAPSWAWLVLLVPILAGLPGAVPRDRWTYAIFGAAILLVAYGLDGFKEGYGLGFVLWLMGVVIISDIAGYLFGRIFGGPKFWPSLSPKKTWSGTVVGWVGAVLLGTVLWLMNKGGPGLIWLSPLICFAGQMGDIAESWLKRRAGVKDSSNLIPGHGGFMDRFDAVTGAVLAVMLVEAVTTLPVID